MIYLLEHPLASVLFIAFGLGMLFLELFIPSLGILGVCGAASAAFGVYGLFHQGHEVVGAVAIVTIIGFVVFTIRYWLNMVTLKDTTTPEMSSGVDVSHESLVVGQCGTAHTVLRPAGVALFGGKRVDVVSNGNFIGKGDPVSIVEVSGNRVMVRRSTADVDEESVSEKQELN